MKNNLQKNNHSLMELSSIDSISAIFLKKPLAVFIQAANDQYYFSSPSQQNLSYNSRSQITQIDGSRTTVNDISNFAYYDCSDTAQARCGQLQTLTNALGHTVKTKGTHLFN